MKVRCPYCKHVFVPGRSCCPACGRTVLLPGFYGRGRPTEDAIAHARARLSDSAPPRFFLFSRPLMVIAALVLLALVSLPVIRSARSPAELSEAYRRRLAHDNLAVLRVALQRLHADCGRYPDTAEGLVALIHNPGIAGWSGPYIIELKPDPWRRRFAYDSDGYRFQVSSAGPDGIPGTEQDIVLHGAPP